MRTLQRVSVAAAVLFGLGAAAAFRWAWGNPAPLSSIPADPAALFLSFVLVLAAAVCLVFSVWR